MPKPKLVVAARVTPDLRERLRQLAKRRRQSISDLVTEALTQYVESQR
jgi:predicted transcriptional regulator